MTNDIYNFVMGGNFNKRIQWAGNVASKEVIAHLNIAYTGYIGELFRGDGFCEVDFYPA